jgi:hypothetical protein
MVSLYHVTPTAALTAAQLRRTCGGVLSACCMHSGTTRTVPSALAMHIHSITHRSSDSSGPRARFASFLYRINCDVRLRVVPMAAMAPPGAKFARLYTTMHTLYCSMILAAALTACQQTGCPRGLGSNNCVQFLIIIQLHASRNTARTHTCLDNRHSWSAG